MFDPKGPVAQQLTPLLVTELTSKYNIPDDAKDVADYIIMLIGNGRPANEIVAETKEIVNIPIDEVFIGTVFTEIGRLEALAAANQPSADENKARRNVKFQKDADVRGKLGAVNKPRVSKGITKIPTKPAGKASKDFVAKKELPTQPKGQAIAEKKLLEKIKLHMPELLASHVQGVEDCKFGAMCAKELCPYGHPTPANQSAKVMVKKWCKFNKKCGNSHCHFAHPSPFTGQKRVATSLEQCKFNKGCTSATCPRRHATSLVACQRGDDCKLPFCTFNHTIDEECRHKNECTNKVCYFKHPDAREQNLFKLNTGASEATNERAFAVPEDQVMEQAVQ